MKDLICMFAAFLVSLSALAFGQSDPQMKMPTETTAPAVQSGAQMSFTHLKALAGNWQGAVTVDPPMKDMGSGSLTQVSLRVTSRGNALVHEMKEVGKPDDPTKYDHPLTMFYLDADRLLLTHYCDAGNRPRMAARTSSDGKTIEFDFLDVAGGTQYGHMHHALFTIIDDNHHIEEWTYMIPGDKPVHARMDLKRVQ